MRMKKGRRQGMEKRKKGSGGEEVDEGDRRENEGMGGG